jgi:sigma-B regulation protein RsbU (phosphoserine phosphatase)
MPRQRIFHAICLLLFLASASRALTQDDAADPRNLDASAYGERVTLGPEWLFAPGDELARASPAFDDSKWRTISVRHPLADYGYHDIAYAWYRIHVLHLPPGVHNLTLGVREVSGSYEVYANGVRIGGKGPMSGPVERVQTKLEPFSIPDGLVTRNGELVLAFRFALNVAGSNGRGSSNPMERDTGVYLMSSDSVTHETSYVMAHKATVNIVLAGLGLLVGIVAIGLFSAMHDRREYLAAAVFLLAFSGEAAVRVWDSATAYTIAADWVQYFCIGVATVALIEFVRLVLGKRRTRWLLGLEIASFAAAFGSPMARSGIGSVYVDFVLFFLPILVVDVLLAVMLLRGWRRGNSEARRLLMAVLIYSVAQYWNFGRYLALFLHLTPTLKDLPSVMIMSYEIPLSTYVNFIFFIVILRFLVQRTVNIARENGRSAAELESARSVQQVLIPDEVPAVPGFAIQSVYKPAGQVGGDFFQILPTKNGGVLGVIGDVSGKGMPAAMTVSLLVGTFRTLADYTQSPGEILAAMNHRMLTRSHGGFTTCLVLRADADGKLTVANAGHIAPYLAGKELDLENGLPLGLSAETTYAESTFQLRAGQQLTLLTDGVVEARDKSGALFGFERAAALSIQPAEAIAQTAQAFGQDDDITALTLTLAPAGATHA